MRAGTADESLFRYVPHGAVDAFWRGPGRSVFDRYRECLLEGPAGSGKTFGAIVALHTVAKEAPPGTRQLWVRQTRRSMTESVLTTFEDKVLPLDTEWRRLLLSKGSKAGRTCYDYPNCHIAIGTMEHPDRLYSTEWDIVWEEEATEIGFQPSMKFKRSLRNNALPWQFHLRTTNPKSRHHWLNRRFPQGVRRMSRSGPREQMIRLLSRHEDNPTLTPEYLEELASLPEPLRSQLYEGKWVSAEGLVWPQFREDRHILWSTLRQDGPQWFLVHDESGEQIELRWFFGSMDFGINAPGCLLVWGVDKHRRAFCVAEVYEPGMDATQWAEVVTDLYAHYRFRAVIGDSADPGSIRILNARLSKTYGKGVGGIVRGSDKSRGVQHGIGVVRDSLHRGLLYWLPDDARLIRGANAELLKAGKPTCSTQEILDYTYPSLEDLPEERADKLAKEERPDGRCADHGCDAVRYGDVWLHGSERPDHGRPPPGPGEVFPSDDYAGIMR